MKLNQSRNSGDIQEHAFVPLSKCKL